MSLLLTSFAPWRAHHRTNASDDLIEFLQSRGQLSQNIQVIRQLPVHSQLAASRVIVSAFQQRPSVIVCCGMSEGRGLLNLERYARCRNSRLETPLNLDLLCQGTRWTTVSEDAGNYVCNDLYYRLLAFIRTHCLPTHGLFVHVPPLTEHNQDLLSEDLALILSRLQNADYLFQLTAA